jgi:hypothetical protein
MDASAVKFVPPYGVPWDTFIKLFDKMKDQGIPLRVDRSYLHDKSGNVQTYLMQALRGFGLVDENHAPLDRLVDIVEADSERPTRLGDLIREHYAPIVALGSTNATQGQLEELWTETFDQKGDTRRKAVRFFLSAAGYAGIGLSKLWKAPRAATAGSVRRRANKPDGQNRADNGSGTGEPSTLQGDTYTVALKSGGKVALTVSVSHFALSKNRADRDFVNGLIDSLTDYGEVEEAHSPTPIEEIE